MKTEAQLKERRDKLIQEIDSAPCWGAAVGVMGEELRGIERVLKAREVAAKGEV